MNYCRLKEKLKDYDKSELVSDLALSNQGAIDDEEHNDAYGRVLEFIYDIMEEAE